MIIVVNGESLGVFAEGMGLTDLLREMELPPEQRASRLRETVTWCCASWPDTTLLAGDRLGDPPPPPPRDDVLLIAGERFTSRLIMGTGGSPSLDVLERALEASGTEIVTVALRRLDPSGSCLILDAPLGRSGRRILPNTAGCFTAHDAVTTARLPAPSFETNWIKLEVIADGDTLLPDGAELLVAAEQLIDDGFVVLPHPVNDVSSFPRLEDLGCAAVPRLGRRSQRIGHPQPLQPADAARACLVYPSSSMWVWGRRRFSRRAGLLTAVVALVITRAAGAGAHGTSHRRGVEAGRLAYRGGRIPQRLYAEASTGGKVWPTSATALGRWPRSARPSQDVDASA